MDRLESLRAQWHRASEKDKHHEAVKVLVELERLEPQEPRWSQRLGESHRRVGNTKDAVDAFARAYQRYFERGFLPRAIAMAKLVKTLDAARGDLLEASLPKGALPPPLPLGRPAGAAAATAIVGITPLAPAKAVVKPPPLPAADGPKPARGAAPPLLEADGPKPARGVAPPLPAADGPKPARGAAPPLPAADGPKPARGVAPPLPAADGPKPARGAPLPPPPPLPAEPLPLVTVKQPSVEPPPLPPRVRPAPLTRADDSTADEIRFADAPDASIEILLVDFSSSGSVDVDVDVDPEDDAPPTRPLGEGPARTREERTLDAQRAMASFRLFASLSRDALVALSNAAELVEFVPGAMIIVRDERAFALYAIVSGAARVIVAGSSGEIRLKEGDIFGEASLLDEGQRQADVRAETPLMTLRVEKRALDAVTKEHPEIEDALFDLLARRLITNLMHTSPLFAAFEPAVRLELAQKFEVRRAPAGTVIAERGRRSDGLYVILAGNVMTEPDSGAPTRIARGTAFGHASLLGSGTADVTVRAASEAVLLRMPAAGFGSLAALYPPALAHLAETANEPLPMSRREP
ncbi:MAG: cyclic nucleotide-binding domain-containing protein [Labilithrix sp.]|nr:cyclic nucleotide-binding domain-containing protein [Labilithrix sp.]